jgi:hypothetical protein
LFQNTIWKKDILEKTHSISDIICILLSKVSQTNQKNSFVFGLSVKGKMDNSTHVGVFHYIYVKEKEKEDKELKRFQTNLENLTKVGIKKGAPSINQDYEGMLEDVCEKMFPQQTQTEVQLKPLNPYCDHG